MHIENPASFIADPRWMFYPVMCSECSWMRIRKDSFPAPDSKCKVKQQPTLGKAWNKETLFWLLLPLQPTLSAYLSPLWHDLISTQRKVCLAVSQAVCHLVMLPTQLAALSVWRSLKSISVCLWGMTSQPFICLWQLFIKAIRSARCTSVTAAQWLNDHHGDKWIKNEAKALPL